MEYNLFKRNFFDMKKAYDKPNEQSSLAFVPIGGQNLNLSALISKIVRNNTFF